MNTRIRKMLYRVLMFASLLTASTMADGTKPNFLFVMIDDMAPDALFNHRFPFLKTPNLNRLAKEGAVFENMMVTTSLCSPSRASILTGTYAHVHGVRYNEIQDPDPKLTQYPQALQKVGYKTAQIGKWHMARHARPRPGFDYWLSFKGQGVYNHPEFNENGTVVKKKGYISYPHESVDEGNFGELYHLRKDTKELKNLIHSPEAAPQLEKMKQLLEDAKKQYGYTEPPYQYTP